MVRFPSACLLACLLLFGRQGHSLPAEAVTPINNREYAPAVQQLIQKARKSLHIMIYQARYYEEYPNTLTNHYVRDLIDAKQRGVDVTVLVDTGEWNPTQKNEYNLDFVDRLTTAGIRVWEDHPQDVSHQKVICVDDDLTVIASSNWLYYSIAKNNEVAAVIYSKPLNKWFKGYFLERLSGARPRANVCEVSTTAPRTAGVTPVLTAAGLPGFRKLPVADVEPVTNRTFYPAVHDALLSATKSVNVVQRSINRQSRPPMRDGEALPGEPASQVNVLVEDLVAASKRGVKVRVVLDQTEGMDDSENDVTAQYLLENGVPVFRDDLANQTHAKMLTIDEDKTVLGSTNWTHAAMENGNEASVLITSAEVNRAYRDYVDAIVKAGAPYTIVKRSIWDETTTATPARR